MFNPLEEWHSEAVVELLDLLARLVTEADGIEKEWEGRSAEGSFAKQDIEKTTSPLQARTFAWMRQLLGLGDLLMLAANDHIQTLLDTRSRRSFRFASPTLARAALDVLARAWWVMDTTVDARTRLGRVMTEEWFSLRERRKLAPEYFPSEDPRAEAQFQRDALTLGVPVRRDKRGRIAGFGTGRRVATDLIESMLGEEIEGPYGKDLWRIASAATHGVTHGMLYRVRYVNKEGDTAEVQVYDYFLRQLLGATAIGYVITYERRARYRGWPRMQWEAWETEPVDLVRQIVRAVPPG